MLPIITTQELGLGVPTGLIINELRTSSDQSLVLDAESGSVMLENPISTSSAPEFDIDPVTVRSILKNGFQQAA